MTVRDEFQVRLTKIAIDPDRFGRLHPVVWFEPVLHGGRLVDNVHVEQLDMARDYAAGDHVSLRFICDIPQLGPVVAQAPADQRKPHVIPEWCHHCHQRLVVRNGLYYCQGDTCPRTTFARLSYATREDVLDLPLCKNALVYVFWGCELVDDLPTLLFLDTPGLEGECYDRTESEMIVSALRTRVDQLFGRNCSRETQLDVQGRILDALSLTGLYNRDRRKLHQRLKRRAWDWGDLAYVLTDTAFLRSGGITPEDARNIAQHARHRALELDTLAREF